VGAVVRSRGIQCQRYWTFR